MFVFELLYPPITIIQSTLLEISSQEFCLFEVASQIVFSIITFSSTKLVVCEIIYKFCLFFIISASSFVFITQNLSPQYPIIALISGWFLSPMIIISYPFSTFFSIFLYIFNKTGQVQSIYLCPSSAIFFFIFGCIPWERKTIVPCSSFSKSSITLSPFLLNFSTTCGLWINSP